MAGAGLSACADSQGAAAPACNAGAHHVTFQRGRLLPVQELQPLVLIPVLCASVPGRATQPLMVLLGSTLPLTGLHHLKRVRKTPNSGQNIEIIVTTVAPEQASAWQQQAGRPELPQGETNADAHPSQPTVPSLAGSKNMTKALQTNGEAAWDVELSSAGLPAQVVTALEGAGVQGLSIVQVPRNAPQTRDQHLEWCKEHWPMTWKVPEGGEPTLTGDALLLPLADQAYMETHMSALIHEYLTVSSVKGDTGAPVVGACCNMARIVDPASGEVVGAGRDGRPGHPLEHAALRAIAAVSARDLALWPPGFDGQEGLEASGGGAEDGGKGSEVKGVINKRPRLENGSDRHTGARMGGGGVQGDGWEAHGGEGKPDKGAGGDRGAALPPKPYMCTGYDCFLVKEPCMMCAMGLVHSRLARVVYVVKDPVGGALGGYAMLMRQRSLNHHYKVYHLPIASLHGAQREGGTQATV